MNEIIVIDSSIWIRVFRTGADPGLTAKVDSLIHEDKAAIVPIIKAEVLAGASSKEDFNNLKESFDCLKCFEIDNDAWDLCGEWALNLRMKGYSLPLADVLIASTAYKNDALVMHADKHFDLIESVYPLKAENYLN